MLPKVTIEWVNNKPALSNTEELLQWMTTQISSETAPDIIFANGNTYADKGWYVNLEEVINTPNPYIEGNESWSDTFPNYVLESNVLNDINGNLICVPFTVYSGPATVYYYNTELFDELGLEVPSSWEELLAVTKKANDAGYIGMAPWIGNKTVNAGVWDFQFSLTPVYTVPLMDKIDGNGDGILDNQESLKAAYEGEFLLSDNQHGQDLFRQVKRKYSQYLPEGYENIDFDPLWNEGKVVMYEDGIWRYPAELANTNRSFEFDMFPPPVAREDQISTDGEIEYTKIGLYQPWPQIIFNIVKPSVEAHGTMEVAIDFMQFLTAPENLSQMVIEKRGEGLGAVKGTAIPPELTEWFNRPFPILPQAYWGMTYTSDTSSELNKNLEMWVKDMITDEEFFSKFDELQKQSVEISIEDNSIDTTGWTKGW